MYDDAVYYVYIWLTCSMDCYMLYIHSYILNTQLYCFLYEHQRIPCTYSTPPISPPRSPKVAHPLATWLSISTPLVYLCFGLVRDIFQHANLKNGIDHHKHDGTATSQLWWKKQNHRNHHLHHHHSSSNDHPHPSNRPHNHSNLLPRSPFAKHIPSVNIRTVLNSSHNTHPHCLRTTTSYTWCWH